MPFSLDSIIQRHCLQVAPDRPIFDVITAMSCQRSSYALIVDQERVVGIFTERTVVQLTATGHYNPQQAIAQVMTREVFTLMETDWTDTFAVLQEMKRHRIRHLPILNADQTLKGIVTLDSIRRSLQPHHLLSVRRVEEVMTQAVLCAPPTTSLQQLTQLMRDHQVSCVVIVAAEEMPSTKTSEPFISTLIAPSPIGVVTERDIVQFRALGIDFANTQAETVMSAPLATVQPQDTLWTVHQTMEQLRVRRLIVVDSSRSLAGIITQSDVMRSLDPVEMYTVLEAMQQTLATTQQQLEVEAAQRRQSDEKFARIFQSSPDAIALTAMEDGRLLEFNPGFEQLFEVSRREHLGQSILDLGLWEDGNNRRQLAQQVQAQGAVHNVEIAARTYTGQPKTMLTSAEYMELDGQACILSITKDISDRKRTERQLQQERDFRVALENSIVEGIAIVDVDTGVQTYVNQSFCKMMGWSELELVGATPPFVYWPPESHNQIQQMFDECLQGQCFREVMEVQFMRRNGERFDALLLNAPLREPSGEIKSWIATVLDISDRKQAEEAVNASERRFQEIAQTVNQLFFVRSATTREFLYVNLAYEHIWGRSCEDLYENPEIWLDSVHPSDRLLVEQSLQNQFEQQQSVICEYRILRPDGEVRWIFTQIKVTQVDDTNHPIQFVGFAADITDRKRAEQALQDSEARLRRLAENLPGMVYRYEMYVDGTDAFTYVSHRCQEIYGVDNEAVLQDASHLWNTVHPDDLATFRESIDRCIHPRLMPWSHEHRIITPNQDIRWVRAVAQPTHDNGTLIWDGFSEDITDRKQASLQLYEQEQKLRALVNNVPVGILLHDAGSEILMSNRMAQELLGLPPDELQGRTCSHPNWDIVDEQYQPIPNNELPTTQAIVAGQPVENVVVGVYREREGDRLWLLVNAIPQFNAEGSLSYVIASFNNITPLKQAETALRESEKQLRQIAEHIQDVFYLKEIGTGNIVYTNRMHAQIYQQVPENEKHESQLWLDKVHPDDRDRIQSQYERQLRAEDFFDEEYRIMLPNGEIRWVSDRSFPIYDDAGHIYRYAGVNRDITDQKQTELTLNRALQELRYHINNSPLATIEWDANGVIRQWSHQAETIFGWLATEIIGRSWYDWQFVHEDDVEHVTHIVQELFEGQKVQNSCHNRNYRNDGTVIDCEWYNSASFDDSGKMVSMLSLVLDVSDRKRAEAERDQQRAFLQQIIDTTPSLIAVRSPDGRLQALNQAAARIHGVTPHELIGKQESDVRTIDGDWMNDLLLRNQQVIDTGKMQVVDDELITTNSGELRWYQTTLSPFVDGHGTISGIIANSIDITERKQVEMSLRQSEARLRLAMEAAQLSCWELDWATQIMTGIGQFTNGEWHTDAWQSHQIQVMRRIHPRDRDRIRKALTNVANFQSEFALEHRLSNFETYPRWFSIRGKAIVNDAGETERIVGILSDITNRKRFEEELLNQKGFIERLTDDLPQTLYIFDLEDRRNIYINRQVTPMLGYTPKEVQQGRSDFLFHRIHPDDWLLHRNHFHRWRLASDDQVLESEFRFQHKDGTWRWLRSREVVFTRNQNGQPIQVLGTTIDITMRKETELALQRSLDEKDVLLSEVHHRVKNNLQIVASLLQLQANRVQDSDTQQSLEESVNRIQSMVMVHERLYQAQNFSEVDFADYAQMLVTNLIQSYGCSGRIQPVIRIDSAIAINLERAIPCGLLVNELVTNSLKHGLLAHSPSQLYVELQRDASFHESQIRLTIGNDGDTLPPDFDPYSNYGSMGLRLVLALVDQLEGELDIERGSRTLFHVRFPSTVSDEEVAI